MIIACLLGGVAHAQEAAWATYREANTLAQAKAWRAALPKFRAVLEVATEPALRTAACYGVGLAAHALVLGDPDQRLACEGRAALDCFLGSAPPSPEARARATARRVDLHAVCEPPAPPPPPPPTDRSAAVWATTGAGVALIGGGLLVGVAFSDAAEVRDRGRVGTEDLEDRAQARLVTGYTLLGVGAILGGVATLLWLDDTSTDSATIHPAGLGIGGRF